jgi:hypothetical protein
MLMDAAPLRRAAPNPADPSSRNCPGSRKQIGSQKAILPIAWWASLNERVVTAANAMPSNRLW